MKITSEQFDHLKQIIFAAGDAIMTIYGDQTLWDTQQKSNDTPVTAADLAAQEILVKGLSLLIPELPILSEEGLMTDWQTRRQWSTYWLQRRIYRQYRSYCSRTRYFRVSLCPCQRNAVLG